eukprot:TRINITY_DN957_c1_g1_i1.p1 TRINITY_DN957_c1_g1~~TRINITY_DN957_c1_g1_i1.p1  ORF type:complete len:744 (+),score=83.68 TRINITY_DN957_c1_g1_i1:320-2233(+)
MDGYVMLSTKDCAQVLSYRLHGVDPECSKPGYEDENACTIQIHEGEKCHHPQKAYYKRNFADKFPKMKEYYRKTHIDKNPWTKVRYTSYGYHAEHEYLPVYAGLEADDVWGKTVVVYNSKGHKLACSRLERVKVTYAPHLAPYPGTKADYCVQGNIHLSTKDRNQFLTYDLDGVDPRCKSTERLEEGRCSIRIHEGKDCNSAGKPFWINGKDKYVPWNHLRYYSRDGDKAWDRHVKIYTGLPMAKIAYRTVVVYDYDGKRISCSKLFPVTRLRTSKLHVYPGSTTSFEVKGRIKVKKQVHKTMLAYKMTDVDPRCSGKRHDPLYACGVVVHEGYRCGEAGHAFWDKAYAKENPWKESLYAANYKHNARGRNFVYTGKDLADMMDRSVVVYDYDGEPIACSILKPPRVFRYQSEQVCKKPEPEPAIDRAPGAGPPEKKECFPADAMVQVSQTLRLPLWQVEVGQEILAKSTSGEVSFEKVVGVVHRIASAVSNKSSRGGSLLEIEHELGSFRATSNHIIFTNSGDRAVGSVLVGDYLRFMQGEAMAMSRVHAVAPSPSVGGLVSPLTASGSAIVDGVLASTYADGHSATARHAAMHAAFFALRSVAAVPKVFLCFLGTSSLRASMNYLPLLLPSTKGA